MYDLELHWVVLVVNVDKFRAMQAFVEAVECGCYAGAAVRLAVSPQMIARHVKSLEEHLGVRLLNRTTRRQSLTEFGQRYFERCKFILNESDAADSLAKEALSAPRGKIRVSAPINFGAGCFMSFIQLFLERYPETELELTLTDEMVNLTRDGFEVAIRIGGEDSEVGTLVRREIKPYKHRVYASPSYLEKNGAPQHPHDLAQHRCASYLRPERTAEECWRFTRDGVAHEAVFKSRLHVNDLRALIAVGIHGYGLILAPEDTVTDEVRTGLLVPALQGYDGTSKPFSIVYRADRQRTANIRAFVDDAAEYFKKFG